MALQGHRPALLHRNPLSHDTLVFLRAASASTLAGSWPYNIPTGYKAPPYPYGPAVHYRRRDKGLYGTTNLQYGNNVSAKNEVKSRKVWRPNVHHKKLWSNYLGRFVQLNIVTRVLRTIDKVGGLDEYLVGNDSPARIKELGVMGWNLRWRMMQTKGYKERVAKERLTLGLPEKGWAVEEGLRKKRERREAIRIAEAFIEALKAESTPRPKTQQIPMDKDDVAASVDLMKEQDVPVAEQEGIDQRSDGEVKAYTADAKNELETESELLEEPAEAEDQARNKNFEPVTELNDSAMPSFAMPSPSEQLLMQLTTMAAQLRTTPDEIIEKARIMTRNRADNIALVADRKEQLSTEQADLTSEIDILLADSDNEPILEFHKTHLAVAQSENALDRERKRKPPLSPAQVKLNVVGPPSNIPADKWTELRERVKKIPKPEPTPEVDTAAEEARRVARRQYLKEGLNKVVVEAKDRRKGQNFYGRTMYQVGWIRRNGLLAWLRRANQRVEEKRGEEKALWTRSKSLFTRKKPE